MAKSNIEVIEAFLAKEVASSHTGNLYSTGHSLVNYRTTLASWEDDKWGRPVIEVDLARYSNTTSKIQHYLKSKINTELNDVIEIYNIDTGEIVKAGDL